MVQFIVLAAGKGTRMKSNFSKVFHKIAQSSLIEIVLSLANAFNNARTITVSSEENDTQIKQFTPLTVVQKNRLGTGNAVKEALPWLLDEGKTFILYGDTPLITHETLKRMEAVQADIVVLGFKGNLDDKYGRLILDGDNNVCKIVEFKDLKKDQQNINLFNSGVFLVKSKILKDLIPKISNDNKSQEYYLTDIVELANNIGAVSKFILCKEEEVIGVNTRLDLAKCENIMQERLREKHMMNGVTLLDPNSVTFALDTKIQNDVVIEPNVFFGKNVDIASNCNIKSFSYLEGCKIEEGVNIGPFARIRPQTTIKSSSKIGNFVEIKNSTLHSEVKAGHLTYIGDADIENNVNIGAGTIFCNYDGVIKHKTQIKKDVFIGSNCSIIAPLTVGQCSTVGAGSVLTHDVPSNSLAISRSKQVNKPNYNK